MSIDLCEETQSRTAERYIGVTRCDLYDTLKEAGRESGKCSGTRGRIERRESLYCLKANVRIGIAQKPASVSKVRRCPTSTSDKLSSKRRVHAYIQRGYRGGNLGSDGRKYR